MISGAAAANMVSSDAGSAPEIDREDNPAIDAESVAEQARSAVWVGLYVSAARCLLTYVVAPVVGAVGVFLGPLGLLLQVLGTITAVGGARRLWSLRHRGRFVYALVAIALVLFTAGTAGQLVLGGRA
jgi:hypothetical protein